MEWVEGEVWSDPQGGGRYEGIWPPPNREIISGEPALRAGPPLSRGFLLRDSFATI